MSKVLIVYGYCDGCGKKIMVGETAFETGDRLGDPQYSCLTFCEKCCKEINTLHWWKRWVEEEEAET